jgi:hypothetical protein
LLIFFEFTAKKVPHISVRNLEEAYLKAGRAVTPPMLKACSGRLLKF